MSMNALEKLQSPAQVELLDAIDRLRLEGCSNGELDLPQLIVCGDQSSGKSSVLEAISRVQFPASDTFCTRFASELILRKATAQDFSVTLVPAPNRSDEEKRFISTYTAPPELSALDDFPKVVKLAGEHIDNLRRNGRQKSAFYSDKLVAHIRGPHLPPLTLVDLPGLIHTSGETQTAQDIAVVRKILNDYMEDKNSIILSVLAADNNKANQEVLQLAKEHDQNGSRTLGIITKPDKLDGGSNSEAEWIKRAQNQLSPLRLGWHVLKNRSFEHRDVTSEERDALETKFFEVSNWAAVPKECRGIASLRSRLSNVLLRSVRECLPGISRGIEEGILSSEAKLEKLGEPKTTIQEQQKYLTEISFKLMELVKASVQGRYNGSFYAGTDADSIASRKVRSRLQDALDDFVAEMSSRGHRFAIRDTKWKNSKTGQQVILDLPATFSSGTGDSNPIEVSRHDFLHSTAFFIRQNRGCELPGLLSSEVVTHLFHLQSEPWEALSQDCADRCWTHIRDFFRQALDYVAPSHTADTVMEHFATARLEAIRGALRQKVKELMQPYRKDHLITLNRAQLMEMCQQQPLLPEEGDEKHENAPWAKNVSSNELAAASQALVCMQAYYHIAGLTFMETVATLAIENALVDGLLNLFTPVTVPDLDGKMLGALTAEPRSVASERRSNQERLKVLRDVSFIIRRHAGRSHYANDCTPEATAADHPFQETKPQSQVDIKTPQVGNTKNIPDATSQREPFVFRSNIITPPPTPPQAASKSGRRARPAERSPSPLAEGAPIRSQSQSGFSLH